MGGGGGVAWLPKQEHVVNHKKTVAERNCGNIRNIAC